MRQASTKEGRKAIQQAQFKHLLEKGYSQETYKGLEIFTNTGTHGERITHELKIFRDNVSEAILFYYYTDIARRAAKIAEAKQNYDSRQEWKEKNPPRKTGAAECATAIREELKKEFPGITFRVRCQNFSMGDSVDIDWQDGPTVAQVERFTAKYQAGHFDSSQDMYEYHGNHSGPSAKYVMEQRSISDATKAAILPDAERIYAQFEQYESEGCHNVDNFIYRIFVNCSIPAGAKITGMIATGETCGQFADLYKIAFETTEKPAAPVFEKVEKTPGQVNIIQYSEKAIAVIGDTKPIKDTLKSLGGSFNFRLTCGPGWIFPAGKLAAIQEALTPKPVRELREEIQNTIDFFKETDIQLCGAVTPETLQAISKQNTNTAVYV